MSEPQSPDKKRIRADAELVSIVKDELAKLKKKYPKEYESRKGEVVIEAKKEVIRRRCYIDLYYFVENVLGIGEWVEKRSGRRRLDPKLHRKMCNELMVDEDTLQLYPRNHMKSTMLKAWIVWIVVQNPLRKVALFSKTRALAKKELKSIKAMLETPLLQELWPDVCVPRKEWEVNNSTQVTMKRPAGCTIQEPQIEIYGIDNTIAGHHYDYHAYDDVVDDKSVRTAAQIEKTIDSWQMLQVVKDKGAIEKGVGTRYHLHDLYGWIIREGLFKAKNTIIVRCLGANGKPVYSLYTKKDLDKLKKKMGDDNFEAQMNNNPVSESSKVFTGPYPLYSYVNVIKQVPPESRVYYAAMDPAATATQMSDQTGIAIGFVDRRDPRCLFMEKAYGVKLKSEKLAEEFIRICAQYDPKYFGIEQGLQTHLSTVIKLKVAEWEKKNRRALKYKILPISTGHTKKAIKFSRILSPFLNDRRMLLPGELDRHGDLQVMNSFLPAVYQMDFYNPSSEKNDDDIIDAMNMIIQCVEYFSQGHWFNVKREEEDVGFTYETIYKEFYAKQDAVYGSGMLV